MGMIETEKKTTSMKKKHKRKIVAVVVVISIVVPSLIFFFSQVSRENGTPFTSLQLEQANRILGNRTSLNDLESDWIGLHGTETHGKIANNPNPYPADFGDYKRLTLAADSQYLYVKTEVYGAFPSSFSEVPSFSGDKIQSVIMKLIIVNDDNEMQALMIGGVNYHAGLFPSLIRYFFVHYIGIIDGEEAFQDQYFEGLITGGFGCDYIIQAFPLEKLGLQQGDTIRIQAFLEAGSDKYHHALIDNLNDELTQGQKEQPIYTVTI